MEDLRVVARQRPGLPYRLETTTDLSGPPWEALTDVTGTGDPASHLDSPGDFPARYYRITRLP